MRSFALLLLLAVAPALTADESSKDVRIQVNPDGSLRYLTGHCLTNETKSFTVVSDRKWICEVRFDVPPETSATDTPYDEEFHLIPGTDPVTCKPTRIEPGPNKSLFVVLKRFDGLTNIDAWIPVYPTIRPDTPGLLWIARATLFFSVLIAFFAWFLAFRVSRIALPDFGQAIENLGRIASTPPLADSHPTPTESENTPPADDRFRILAEEIDEFYGTVERWLKEFARINNAGSTNLIDLLEKLKQHGRKVREPAELRAARIDSLEETFRRIREDIVPAVVSSHDRAPNNPPRQLDEYLEAVVTAAGMDLIDPRPGDPFKGELHSNVERVPNSPFAGQNCVAKTIVRGLRQRGRIILRAEVAVYDA